LIVVWRVIAAVDAFRAPAAARKMHWAILVGMSLGLLFGKEGVALAIRANVLEAFRMPNPGMAPTLLTGDRFFVAKLRATIHRGDVLVFHRPDGSRTPYLKRVVGEGGDVVAMAGDQLTVNGTPVIRRVTDEGCPVDVEKGTCVVWEEILGDRTYRVLETTFGHRYDEAWTITVPPDSYFVLGDNRDNSNDSRHFGSVPKVNRIGVPTFIWWSKDDDGLRFDRMNRRVR
jgi:signal peptidase I